jgi:hypothetical protein
MQFERVALSIRDCNNLSFHTIKDIIMWKIAVGFILFAGLALFIIFKAGDKVDMQGESGNMTEVHESASAHAEATPASLPAATPTAPAADAAATSASK